MTDTKDRITVLEIEVERLQAEKHDLAVKYTEARDWINGAVAACVKNECSKRDRLLAEAREERDEAIKMRDRWYGEMQTEGKEYEQEIADLRRALEDAERAVESARDDVAMRNTDRAHGTLTAALTRVRAALRGEGKP